MPESYTNICAACRKKARVTQEQWAELLHVSVETVKAWEGGKRVPDNYYVCMMVRFCGDTYFAYQHLLQTSDSLNVLPSTKRQPLPLAVMQLVNRFISFADRNRDRQLLQLAEDGVIDEAERPAYERIMDELNEIIAAAYSLRYAEVTG